MMTTEENKTLHNHQPSRFRNVLLVSIAVPLMGIIFLAATRRIPHPVLFIPVALLGLLIFAVYFLWKLSHEKSEKSRGMSRHLILGGAVFLAASLYGMIEVLIGQTGKLTLLALVVPASLGTWLVRKGLAAGRARRDEGTGNSHV